MKAPLNTMAQPVDDRDWVWEEARDGAGNVVLVKVLRSELERRRQGRLTRAELARERGYQTRGAA